MHHKFQHHFKLLITGLTLSTTLVAGSSFSDPLPVFFNVDAVSYQGDGCPQGSMRAATSLDKQAITLIFDQFYVIASPSTIRHEVAKCSVSIGLDYPEGWQFSVTNVDYRGFVSLEGSSWAKIQANFRYQGSGFQRPAILRLTGPVTTDFAQREEQASGDRGWSPCKKRNKQGIDIATQMVVQTQADQSAYVSFDSIDGNIRPFTELFQLRWRQCR
jgi:hypothetical protein